MAVFCGVLDQIPYFEDGDSVTYNNEKEGIIECLKRNVGGEPNNLLKRFLLLPFG